MQQSRLIGRYDGDDKGALLVVLAAMHGNEPAGVKALEEMFGMLDREKSKNPDFRYRGRMVGFIGNLEAYRQRIRFIDRDMNRLWIEEELTQTQGLTAEHSEIRELLKDIQSEISNYRPDKLILLDLHTTSSHGGIFSIVSEDSESLAIAKEMHAPVIKGLTGGLSGTTLHYFNTENIGIPTVAVTFESGQHEEALSAQRAIAALTHCMQAIGSVDKHHIESRHSQILINYSKDLPEVVRLVYRHAIEPEDEFVMNPGYRNFQAVKESESLAKDKNGEVKASQDAFILMPLYQKQGEDGFFLVKQVQA